MSRPLASPSFRYASRPGYPQPPRRASSTTNLPRGQFPASSVPPLPSGPSRTADSTVETVADFLLSLPHPRHWPGFLFRYLVLDPLRVLLATLLALITSPRTHRVVLRLGVLIALFWTSLILAIFAYIGFYRVWVPDVGRLDEVHLEYGRRGGEMPSALVDLSTWRGSQADGGKGKAMTLGDDWFAEEQEYDVSIELLVPISTANLDLGNFMVSLTFLTSDNITLFHSSKPTILRPTTPPLRFLTQFASHVSSRPSLASTSSAAGAGIGAGSFMLPLPFTSPSLELMNIRLFDRVVLYPSSGTIPFSNPGGRPRRISKAIVRVGRDDSDKYWIYGGGHGVGGVVMGNNAIGDGIQGGLGQGMVLATQNGGAFRSRGELQTVGVGLRFDARLTGLRYLLYTHPIFSFILFTSLFLTFELVSALTLWTIAAVYTSTLPGLGVDLGPDNQFVPYRDGPGAGIRRGGLSDEEEEDDEDDGSSTPRRRGGSGARGFEALSTTATEASNIEEGASYDEDTETEEGSTTGEGPGGSTSAQVRSRASLLDRDAEERREVVLAAEEEARRTGRLMTALATREALRAGGAGAGGSRDSESLHSPGPSATPTAEELLSPSYRRVLGRLDEETEEETDEGTSVISMSDLSDSGTAAGGADDLRSSSSASQVQRRQEIGGGGGGLSSRSIRRGEGDQGSSETTVSSASGSSARAAAEGDDEWEDEEPLSTSSATRVREGQAGGQAEGMRRRKIFEGSDGEDQAGAGDDGASDLGGSATDPSIASGSRRSFGATTQASTSTRQTFASRPSQA